MEEPPEFSYKFCISCGLCDNVPLVPPLDWLPELREQDDAGDDVGLDDVGDSNIAALKEMHRKEKASLEEKHRKEMASAQQKLVASQKEFQNSEVNLEMRQLFNYFKDRYPDIDTQLMEHARKSFSRDFGRSEGKSYFGMVINLVAQNRDLTKTMKDLSCPSSDPRRWDSLKAQLKAVNRKLASLKKVATTFETNEMLWNDSIGEEMYSWCFLVYGTNKACHPEMTKETLDDMSRLAESRVYQYGGVELNNAVKAVIDKVRPT